MTLGPVMMDLEGRELLEHEYPMLRHPLVGGVILFARNYSDPEQLARLAGEVRAAREPPLLIAVDQEGGRVQRFHDGFTRLPAAACFGRAFDTDGEAAAKHATRVGWVLAAELGACGIDLSFAPVLDVDRGLSEVIGARALHHEPQTVARLGLAFAAGMKQAGMHAVGKHYPGHGSVTTDSHVAQPVDQRDYDAVLDEDLGIYRTLIEWGLKGVLASHVAFPRIDSLPAGYSRFWLQRTLRETLGFNGAVFSDDLSMGGAAHGEGVVARVTAALEAGCDMALVCNQPDEVRAVLAALDREPEPQRANRIAALRGTCQGSFEALRASAEYQQAVEAVAAFRQRWDSASDR